jgi:hypothetical protein
MKTTVRTVEYRRNISKDCDIGGWQATLAFGGLLRRAGSASLGPTHTPVFDVASFEVPYFAHLAFCAADILARASALTLRFFFLVGAGTAALPARADVAVAALPGK